MKTVRFAPSPTGRFHLGNLRTAWISNRLARELGMHLWIRFEDIDAPRVLPGAAALQLEDMKAIGIEPDAPPEFQSANREYHHSTLKRAVDEGRAYPCTCSRREVELEIAGVSSAPHESDGPRPIYAGTCRERGRDATLAALKPGRKLVWRFHAPGSPAHDVPIARTDGESSLESFEPAYHWACALDDADPRRQHEWLVRAWDLEQATPIQRAIQAWLRGPDYVPPRVFHAALVTQPDGSRLEKRTRGVTLPEWIAQGSSTERLKRALEQSFPAFSLDGSDSMGEARRTLSVATLLEEAP